MNGVDDYFIASIFSVHRVSDDSYYLVRRIGVNQALWLDYVDIFYYSGEIVDYYDYTPVMYTHVDAEYTTYMGNVYLGINNGYLYYLVSNPENNEYQLACIYEGKEISRYDIGYLDVSWFKEIVCNSDNTVSVSFTDRKSQDLWSYVIDFSDPYNPRYVNILNKTSPEQSGKLYGDYKFVQDVGEKLDTVDYSAADGAYLQPEMYMIEASEADHLLLKPSQTLVFTITDNKGHKHMENDEAWFSFMSAEDVIHVDVGYIKDGVAHSLADTLSNGQTKEKNNGFDLSALPTGEYRMYITNTSGYLQYYDFMGIAVT